MTKNTKILIVAGAVLIIGAIGYVINYNNTKPFITNSWRESYSPIDKGPFGTFVFKELLDTTGVFESFIQLDSKLENSLVDNEDQNDIYFFIGEENHMSENSFEELLDFVDNGNTAFISANTMPSHILDYFFLNLNKTYTSKTDSIQSFSFTSSELSDQTYQFKFYYNNLGTNHKWVFFKHDNFIYHAGDTKVLGKSKSGEANFIKIELENGVVFLHSSPYLLSNISFFRNDGFSYAENMIKYLPYGKIQWDIYNLKYHYDNYDGENKSGRSGENSKRSKFEFIFKHTALTWGFFLLMITAILYIIFKGKRRQNTILATELKENSSLRYIETVSSLYLQERQHNKLIELQKRSFIDFISEHYYIQSHKIDDKYIERVNAKSGIDQDKIRSIFIQFETLSSQIKVSDNELIALQQDIEYFYKTCK